MGAEGKNAKLIDNRPIIDVTPTPSKKRKRPRSRPAVSAGLENEDKAENCELPFDAHGEHLQRRNTGLSPKSLIVDLRHAGFFSALRTSGDIKDELHRKGFSSIRTSDMTGSLITLVRDDILRRDKDQQRNQWVYINGTNNETK